MRLSTLCGLHRDTEQLPWIESTEELGYLGWSPHCSHLHAAVSIGLPPDGAHRGDELLWMESTEELGYLG